MYRSFAGQIVVFFFIGTRRPGGGMGDGTQPTTELSKDSGTVQVVV